MNIFQTLAVLFVIWIFVFLINIRGVIYLFSFLFVAENSRTDFFIRKISELNGLVSQKSKITQNLFFNGTLYLVDETVSRTFFSFGVVSMVLPLISYFVLKIDFFQIVFIVSFVFFFFNTLLYKVGGKELNKFEKDEDINYYAYKKIVQI